jgi:UDP-N-acetylmuramoyl-tripeptide--D-alanyl-D-alanine ligase
MRFELITPQGAREAAIPSLGRHSVHNALAATAASLAAGLDLDEIVAGLERPFHAPHRSTLIEAGTWRILDDTYNAAPDSMVAALDLLATLPGRRVAVLGEMRELGAESEAGHRRVGAHAARTADVLVAVGAPAQIYVDAAEEAGLAPASTHIVREREAALATLGRVLRDGDVVLLKASNGERFFDLVDALRDLSQTETVA